MQSMNDLKALVLAGETNWKQYGEVASQEADGLILFNYTPLALMPDYTTRKEFAELVMKEDPALRSYLFMAYDCKSLRPSVLKTEFKDRRDRMLTGGEG